MAIASIICIKKSVHDIYIFNSGVKIISESLKYNLVFKSVYKSIDLSCIFY